TPINYWNDTYHHGRVFFPTIERPLIFAANIIPLHTTGVSLQGLNLGKIRFGYDLMLGNGLGSNDIMDNDKYKSVTAAIHIKPVEGLRIGTSYYRDIISKGASVHGMIIDRRMKQQLITGSLAYFGKRFELLSESTLALNKGDSLSQKRTIGTYTYGGIKITEKWIPYVRFDFLNYPDGDIFFVKNNTTSFVGGIRYNINYLAVVKLEYQYDHTQLTGSGNKGTLQIAIGF
ncbi:MAG: hypothetical protein ICV65_08550, partial [Flavisolibacter sp.]|nr:hypothetical protein [Flavisolibacter sp.]